MRYATGIVFALAVLLAASCDGLAESEPLEGEQEQEIKAALADRSFRQFSPSRDADQRRAVILEFFDGLTVWAQYTEGDTAITEWEIVSDDYRIESRGELSEVTLYLIEPTSRQALPTECEDCISSAGISLSIRTVFGVEDLSFKLNDPDEVLPPPFPVFTHWTTFNEDEYFE